MTLGLINANPIVREKKERINRAEAADHDAIDPLDIYDILNLISIDLVHIVRDIRDPEHPYSLEQLSVLSEDSITVDHNLARILITFTPTIQHCSMATVIGLCLRIKLKDCFPPHFKLDIKVAPGSHADEEAVNKQLNDKERIVAAMENPNLRQLVEEFDGSRSFSFDRNNKLSASNTSRLASEIGSSHSARFTSYEKLMRLDHHVDYIASNNNRSRNVTWRFLTKIFSLKKSSGGDSEEKMSVPSKSWRPDPNSRWPLQGW
ncbi:hypothetical protein QVD17_36953 [Tagetes erecta]|uniref:MIP18 family-like domain-containing protein n=1 Tax=Tagetes erecta TaxID=13708 RepID=A0AAD8NJE5_TARER|nr:hypothetical protein QVD17_36953 [Tagetes erecta]